MICQDKYNNTRYFCSKTMVICRSIHDTLPKYKKDVEISLQCKYALYDPLAMKFNIYLRSYLGSLHFQSLNITYSPCKEFTRRFLRFTNQRKKLKFINKVSEYMFIMKAG